MEKQKLCGFPEVRLKPGARYRDTLKVPERFAGKTYTVLSHNSSGALLGGIRQHVRPEDLAALEENKKM